MMTITREDLREQTQEAKNKYNLEKGSNFAHQYEIYLYDFEFLIRSTCCKAANLGNYSTELGGKLICEALHKNEPLSDQEWIEMIYWIKGNTEIMAYPVIAYRGFGSNKYQDLQLSWI